MNALPAARAGIRGHSITIQQTEMKQKRKDEQGKEAVRILNISDFRAIACTFPPDIMRDIEAAAAIAGQDLREFAAQAIIRHTYATIGLEEAARKLEKVTLIPRYLPKYSAGQRKP